MKVNIYKYNGDYGDGLVYDTDEKPNDYYRNNEDWDLIGVWELPEDFINKCLPAYYLE